MAGPGQFHYSAGVLSRAWALRAALTDSTLLAEGNDMTPSVRLFWRLICRLNIHHDFVRVLGEANTPYESCSRCGKDLYIPPGPGGGAIFGQWRCLLTEPHQRRTAGRSRAQRHRGGIPPSLSLAQPA
jgi:hypothetical protein